ncbi:MAG: hypothetical protein CSA62_02565 [Planctomycetota bacterium]|nr:MAG: hypothetical protein CSA62_02565 [Planctomycetota bacterium]
MHFVQNHRRPLQPNEVAELSLSSKCPVCHAKQLLIREIPSRLSGKSVRTKQVYCPFCGSTGQQVLKSGAA